MTTRQKLLDIIARGEELRKQGYDVDLLQEINHRLLAEMDGEEKSN